MRGCPARAARSKAEHRVDRPAVALMRAAAVHPLARIRAWPSADVGETGGGSPRHDVFAYAQRGERRSSRGRRPRRAAAWRGCRPASPSATGMRARTIRKGFVGHRQCGKIGTQARPADGRRALEPCAVNAKVRILSDTGSPGRAARAKRADRARSACAAIVNLRHSHGPTHERSRPPPPGARAPLVLRIRSARRHDDAVVPARRASRRSTRRASRCYGKALAPLAAGGWDRLSVVDVACHQGYFSTHARAQGLPRSRRGRRSQRARRRHDADGRRLRAMPTCAPSRPTSRRSTRARWARSTSC